MLGFRSILFLYLFYLPLHTLGCTVDIPSTWFCCYCSVDPPSVHREICGINPREIELEKGFSLRELKRALQTLVDDNPDISSACCQMEKDPMNPGVMPCPVTSLGGNWSICEYPDSDWGSPSQGPSKASQNKEMGRAIDPVIMSLTCISSFFLLMTISVYLFLPSLRNIHGKTILCHLIAFFAFYTVQIIEQALRPSGTLPETSPFCFILGFSTYFGAISAIAWLTIVSFDIWHNSIKMHSKDEESRLFKRYFLFGWITPIVFTGSLVALDFSLSDDHLLKPRIANDERCFFSNKSISIVLYLHGVTGLFVLINLILFLWTNLIMHRVSKVTFKVRTGSNWERILMFFKLYCVMGTSFAISLVLYFTDYYEQSPEDRSILARASECFNFAHGICYFIVFVCKPSTIRLIREKLFSIKYTKVNTASDGGSKGQNPSSNQSTSNTNLPLLSK